MTTVIGAAVHGQRTSVSGPYAPASSYALRGRDTERGVIRELLKQAERGSAGVVLVDGEPGIGKSRLLGDGCQQAEDRAFSLLAGQGDPLAHATPLFTLRAALREPLTGEDPSHECPDAPNAACQLALMRRRLEQRVASGPLLICLDDLHCESEGTLGALRSLYRDLCRRPVAWLLARSSAVRGGASHLFALLEHDGATRITLAPLADDAVQLMLTDAFGAPPDPELTVLASGAAGIPALLAELIGSLCQIKAVEVSNGRSVLTSRNVALQFRHVAQQRLGQVTRGTRHVLLTAAVLGPAFQLEDAADMLGEPPASLLPAIEEAIDTAIVIETEHGFAFSSELLRRAAADIIPVPARRALHRQYGEILLGRGVETTDAASHLLEGADRGDPASLPGLDRAVARTIRSAPQVAADLAVHALKLTQPGDPAVLPRSVIAAEALAAAGRLEQAQAITEATRARPLPHEAEHRLRCVMSWVLCTRGQPREAAAEAAAVLSAGELPRDVLARARAASLQALAAIPTGLTAESEAAPQVRGGTSGTPSALILQACRCWESGQVRESLELAREAARGSRISPDARDAQPLLVLAATLVDLRELDDAEAILGAVTAADLSSLPVGSAVRLLRARAHLAAGRLDEAAAEGAAALAHALASHADSYVASARSVLAVIELRRGRVETAAAHVSNRPVCGMHAASMYARSESSLAEAQVVEASHGPPAALRCLNAFCADLSVRPGPLLADPALAAWLVRTSLAAGDERLAAIAADVAVSVAAANPRFAATCPAASHAKGLLHRDPVSLASSAREHADPWARASAAEDLGVLQERLGQREEAVVGLTSALTQYGQLGARRDEARVRSRLRELGIRRRHWNASSGNRPAEGWLSLTATERAVAGLVAEGLSNGEIADRMYISTHTVAHHLRQAFRKLAITSRVELARMVVERAQDEISTRGNQPR
jgi:DNA-binding CsgD family transcriptional regulator